jgi:hypothetical protein
LGSRKARKIESVPSEIMDEVLAKLATILEFFSEPHPAYHRCGRAPRRLKLQKRRLKT